MKKAFLFVFLTALGCKSEKIGTDFNLKIYQQTKVSNFTLTFDNVADSRCPINVQCFRAGEVVVDLSVNANQKVQMCLGDCQIVQSSRKKGFVVQDSLDVSVDGQKYLFILKQVKPYPVSTTESKDKYEVNMQIEKR